MIKEFFAKIKAMLAKSHEGYMTRCERDEAVNCPYCGTHLTSEYIANNRTLKKNMSIEIPLANFLYMNFVKCPGCGDLMGTQHQTRELHVTPLRTSFSLDDDKVKI